MYNNNDSSFSILAFNNDLDKIESLLKNGTNPNIQDSWGQTPLYHIDNIEKLELLLKYNANPNIQDDSKDTVLHHSLQLRNIDKVKLLLKHGADANAQDNFQDTPLKKVIENQQITSTEKKELLEILLHNGADISNFTLTQKGNIISILCNNTLLSIALKTFLVSEDFMLKQTNHSSIILESTNKIEGKFSIIYDRINKGLSVESQPILDNLFEIELTGDIS